MISRKALLAQRSGAGIHGPCNQRDEMDVGAPEIGACALSLRARRRGGFPSPPVACGAASQDLRVAARWPNPWLERRFNDINRRERVKRRVAGDVGGRHSDRRRHLGFAGTARVDRRGDSRRGRPGGVAHRAEGRSVLADAGRVGRRGLRDFRHHAQRRGRLLAIGGAVERCAAFQRRGRIDRLCDLSRQARSPRC